MSVLQSINASSSPEVQMNENFETIEWTAVYGRRHPVTSGLTWGYYGGYWSGIEITAGTVTLTDDTTNYLVVERATGTLSSSTATTNWDNSEDYARVYAITTLDSVVTDVEDYRAGPNGVHGGGEVAGGGGGTVGKHAVPVLAAAMRPSVSGGCATLAAIATSANQPDIVTLDFDSSTQEFAQFSIPMPSSWNEGTVTFKPIWSHAATTTNFGVVWSLAGVAVGDDDAIGAAFGTEQESADTGGTTNDLYIGPESSAITIAGTPSAGDVVFFRISRVTDSSSDTLAVDARLHGIVLFITTEAETDS